MIRLKRVYEPPSPEDGRRILVERLWPRGMAKARAALDDWVKEAAPSPELRQWYSHDLARWDEFRRRYREELERNPQAIHRLRSLVSQGEVTFIYAAQDEQHNSAVLLKEFLEQG